MNGFPSQSEFPETELAIQSKEIEEPAASRESISLLSAIFAATRRAPKHTGNLVRFCGMAPYFVISQRKYFLV